MLATFISSGDQTQDDLLTRAHYCTFSTANEIVKWKEIWANRATHMVKGEEVEDSTLAVWMSGALCRECEKLTSFLPSQEQWEHSVNNGCKKALSKLSEAERVGAVVSALTMEMDHPLFNKLRFSGQMGSFGEADGSGKQRSQMFNVPGGRCVSICIII